MAWFTVPLAAFSLLSGNPTRYRASDHATRSFCSRCGTQVSFADDHHPEEIDIATCTLDAPDLLPPAKEIYVGSKIAWMPVNQALPQFQQSSDAG